MNAIQKQPLVSIVCVTYNHEKYIEKAIQSFLAQETEFPYEICIGEDNSTDKTREICRKYAEENPDKIRLFLRNREDVIYYNGRPTGRYNFLETLKASRGKYIALCEGDDFWNHHQKLQLQVDFLEKNPDYSLAAHAIHVEQKDGSVQPKIMPPDFFDGNGDLLARQGNYISTLSAVFKRDAVIGRLDMLNGLPCADYPMWLACAQQGKLKYFPYLMGTYRNHGNGSWSSLDRLEELKCNAHLYERLCQEFSEDINGTLRNKACEFLTNLMNASFQMNKQEDAKEYYERILKLDPPYLFQIMRYLMTA